MSPLALRRTVHRGSVLASGLMLDLDLIPERIARERLFVLIELGIEVHRFERFLIAIFREPIRIDASRALGAPLVRFGALLSAAPLAPDERAALETPVEAIVLVTGCRATAVERAALVREDLSQWIDASVFAVIGDVQSLGSVAATPRQTQAPSVTDVRGALGVPALGEEAKHVLESLARKRDSGVSGGRAAGIAISGWFSALWRLFESARTPGRSRARGSPEKTALAVVPATPGISWFSRLRGLVQDWVARALLWSRLAPFVGRRQAAYLRRVFELFDSNRLDDALRHAIPLGSELESALKPPALLTPSPRTDLAIVPARTHAASSLGLGPDLFEALRSRYRAAFERLAAAGAIEKAAFVLAELLNADEEAVSFLERHGRLKLAAQVAEARKLPPGVVIRQWFLAGDRARALEIARRTGAFADAVVRLQRSHKTESEALRLLWADQLASAGAYAAAVDAVWPVERARRLALKWLDDAIAIGGPTGARMLARKLRALPASFPQVRDRVLELFGLEGERVLPALHAFGNELTSGELTDETRVLARAAARRLIREPPDKELNRLVERLLDWSGDAALSADLRGPRKRSERADDGRAAPPLRSLRSLASPLVLRWRAGDRGGLAVSDAAELPDGRILVALGELGAWLVAPSGKVLTRFVEPARYIVLSDHGDRALLVAPRGEACRVTRVDLLTRRIQPWCDARIDRFADSFDGFTWFVSGRGGALYAIDATAETWEHRARVVEANALVDSIRRDSKAMSAWLKHGDGREEIWTFELPSLTLRQRTPIDYGELRCTIGAISAGGRFACWHDPGAGDLVFRALHHGRWIDSPLANASPSLELVLGEEWFAVPLLGPESTAVHLVDSSALQERARLELELSGQSLGVRIQGERLVVFDDLGRVVALSLTSGKVIGEWRIS